MLLFGSCKVSAEKSADDRLMRGSLICDSLFSLLPLELSLTFAVLIMVDVCASCAWVSVSFRFEKFSAII